MITELVTSLFGGGLGVIARMLPEVVKYFQDKADRAHELEMTRLQLEIDKARAEQQIDLAHANAAIAESQGEMAAWTEAIKAQAVQTGIRWADALSASVRPMITYWWQGLFTVVKMFIIFQAIEHFVDADTFISKVWTDNDTGILSMILSFWFVDRVMRKNNGQ